MAGQIHPGYRLRGAELVRWNFLVSAVCYGASSQSGLRGWCTPLVMYSELLTSRQLINYSMDYPRYGYRVAGLRYYIYVFVLGLGGAV